MFQKHHLLARDGCISDGFNCCTFHFRSTALNFWDAPQEVVKSEQKCADFEMELTMLYLCDWPSKGCKLKALQFLINALLVASILKIFSYKINEFQKIYSLGMDSCISLWGSELCAFSNVQSGSGSIHIQCKVYSVKYTVCSLQCAMYIYFLANRARNYIY